MPVAAGTGLQTGAGRRIQGIDTARGICVVLMVLFHLGYDLYFYCGFPAWTVNSLPMAVGQAVASWGFILLAGLSSRLSRSNVRRGLVVLACGLLVSAVAWVWGDPIRFGILQFLGSAMVLYGLTHRLWEALPRAVAPVLYLTLFLVGRYYLPLVVEAPHLYPLGLITPGFRSADYFPLLPWFFWFLLGSWLGSYVRDGRTPQWFRAWKVPPLAFLGRHALVVYLLHQPLLVGVSWLLAWGTGRTLPF
jgi:uncharacterized membrane protein